MPLTSSKIALFSNFILLCNRYFTSFSFKLSASWAYYWLRSFSDVLFTYILIHRILLITSIFVKVHLLTFPTFLHRNWWKLVQKCGKFSLNDFFSIIFLFSTLLFWREKYIWSLFSRVKRKWKNMQINIFCNLANFEIN